MLTKTDLQSIRKIVREEVETEAENIKTELQSDLKMNLVRIVGELRELKDRLKNVEIKINKIQKDIKYAVDFLDKEGLKVVKRVEKVEKRLGLGPVS